MLVFTICTTLLIYTDLPLLRATNTNAEHTWTAHASTAISADHVYGHRLSAVPSDAARNHQSFQDGADRIEHVQHSRRFVGRRAYVETQVSVRHSCAAFGRQRDLSTWRDGATADSEAATRVRRGKCRCALIVIMISLENLTVTACDDLDCTQRRQRC